MSAIIEIMKALHAKKLEETGKVAKPLPANSAEPAKPSNIEQKKVEKPSVAKESEKVVPNEQQNKGKSIKDFVSSLSDSRFSPDNKYKGKK